MIIRNIRPPFASRSSTRLHDGDTFFTGHVHISKLSFSQQSWDNLELVHDKDDDDPDEQKPDDDEVWDSAMEYAALAPIDRYAFCGSVAVRSPGTCSGWSGDARLQINFCGDRWLLRSTSDAYSNITGCNTGLVTRHDTTHQHRRARHQHSVELQRYSS